MIRYWLVFICMYYIVSLPTPQGLVETSYENGVIKVGDWVHVLPSYVDPTLLCASKHDGLLSFHFNYIIEEMPAVKSNYISVKSY
jgi:hypothetical protein